MIRRFAVHPRTELPIWPHADGAAAETAARLDPGSWHTYPTPNGQKIWLTWDGRATVTPPAAVRTSRRLSPINVEGIPPEVLRHPRRIANRAAGLALCSRCLGTGNEWVHRHKDCAHCNATGVCVGCDAEDRPLGQVEAVRVHRSAARSDPWVPFDFATERTR